MNQHYRNIPAAYLIALKRSRFHLVGSTLSLLFVLLFGLPAEFDWIPDVKIIRMIEAAVFTAAVVVSLVWGLIFAGTMSGHFHTALD